MKPDTRTALLDAAEQAARARGFDGFSYADLAAAVGIRKASIHHHFPTKAGLSAALMERYHAAMQQIIADIDARHATAAERLLSLINVYRAALNGGETVCLCVSFSAGRANLPTEVIDRIRSFRRMMAGWIELVFERAAADETITGLTVPAQEACATLALLEGAHLAARAEIDVAAFDRALEALRARCRR